MSTSRPELRGCPACGSFHIDWYEHALGVTHFTQTEEGVDPEGYPNTPDPFKVEGNCRACGHGWTAKRARQIWDIPGHPDFTPKKRPPALPDHRDGEGRG